MNIFEAIRKDHDKQRELCRLVTSTSGEFKGKKGNVGKIEARTTNSRRCRGTHILFTLNP